MTQASTLPGAFQNPAENRLETLARHQRIARRALAGQILVIAGMIWLPEAVFGFLLLLSIPLSLTFFVQMAALSFETYDRTRAFAMCIAMAMPVIGWLAVLRINQSVTRKLRTVGQHVTDFGNFERVRKQKIDKVC